MSCVPGCQTKAKPGANELLGALVECLSTNNCADDACAVKNCPDQVHSCLGVAPPPNPSPDAGTGAGGSTGTASQGTFLDVMSQFNGHAPQLEIDASGVRHYVYEAKTLDDAGKYAIRYGECASNCTSDNGWKFVTVGDVYVDGDAHTTLALTAQGQPRMIWQDRATADGVNTLAFSSCDTNCTQPAGWTRGVFKTFQIGDEVSSWPGRNLAVDASGRLHYLSRVRGPMASSQQLNYATCAGNCSLGSSWRDVSLGYFDGHSSMAVTPAGQVRIAGNGLDNPVVFYQTCETNCDVPANWAPPVGLYYSHSARISLRLDGQGRPRMVFNQSQLGKPNDYMTSYAWCDGDCGKQAGWKAQLIGEERDGVSSLDFDLDSNGNPLVAAVLHSPGGVDGPLALFRCTGNCQTVTGTWTVNVLETTESIGRETRPIGTCPGGVHAIAYWYPGDEASAAFSRQSNQLEIAHRTYIQMQCSSFNGGSSFTEGISVPRFTVGF